MEEGWMVMLNGNWEWKGLAYSVTDALDKALKEYHSQPAYDPRRMKVTSMEAMSFG